MDLGGEELSLLRTGEWSSQFVMAEVTVVPVPPEVTVAGAEAPDTLVWVAAVLSVVMGVVGVNVVVVTVVARLISGLVESPGVAGPEVTAVVAAFRAEEEIKAPGVDATPLPPGDAEVGLYAPEAFSASRRATLSSSAFFSTLCLFLILSAHSCGCCLSCSQTFSTARNMSTSALSLWRSSSVSNSCNWCLYPHLSRLQLPTHCSGLLFSLGLLWGATSSSLTRSLLISACAASDLVLERLIGLSASRAFNSQEVIQILEGSPTLLWRLQRALSLLLAMVDSKEN